MTVLNPRPVPTFDAGLPLAAREDRITQLPVLILFPHSRCNCRCVMCDIWRATGREEIAVSDVERWVGEWKSLGVERVVLSGGEALLHSDLWSLCDVIRRANIGVSILSTSHGVMTDKDARRQKVGGELLCEIW